MKIEAAPAVQVIKWQDVEGGLFDTREAAEFSNLQWAKWEETLREDEDQHQDA